MFQDEQPIGSVFGTAVSFRGQAGVHATAAAVLGLGVAETILDVARRERIGLVALATHGHGGIRRLTLGSVADKLVRATEIPVLVIRPVKVSRRGR